MNDFGYYLSADGRSHQEMTTMPTNGHPYGRRPEAASEQTGAFSLDDIAELKRTLDEVNRRAKRPAPAKPKRPLSWQAALVIVVVVLALAALIGFLAAIHVIPAL